MNVDLVTIIGVITGVLGLYTVWQAYTASTESSVKQRLRESEMFDRVLDAIKHEHEFIESKLTHLTGNIKQNNVGLVEELRSLNETLNKLGTQIEVMRATCDVRYGKE